MAQTFEEFLMWYHASNNPHTDDMLPELYADWITEEVDNEMLIELAEKWHAQEIQWAVNEIDKIIKELEGFKNETITN